MPEFDVKKFNVEQFDKILACGLSKGLGQRGQQVCIEAAICQVLDLPHGDDPGCVAESVRAYKIALNDKKWSSPAARAAGLRDLGLAQLGSKGVVDSKEFAKRMVEKTLRVVIPTLYRELFPNDQEMLDAALRCEQEGTKEAAASAVKAAANAYAAYAYASYASAANAYAAYAASNASAASYASNASAASAASYASNASAAYAASSASDAASSASYASDANAYAAYAASAASYASDAASNASNASAASYASAAASYASDAAYAAYASDAASAASYASASASYASTANAYAAYASASYASNAAKEDTVGDKYLLLSAKLALETLRELNSPGVALLV